MPSKFKFVGFEADVPIATLQPHPAAGLPTAVPDGELLARSVQDMDVRTPLVVMREGKHTWILDGCSRYGAAMKAGRDKLPCVFVECEGPREFVLTMAARRRTTNVGTRVLYELELRGRTALDAHKSAKDRQLKNLRKGQCFPDEARATTETDSAANIAKDLKVSKDDVLAGLDLLSAIADAKDEDARERLIAARDAVLFGDCGIRRWKAAVAGAAHTKGRKKEETNFRKVACAAASGLRTAFKGWGKIDWAALDGNGKLEDFRMIFGESIAIAPAEARAEIAARAVKSWPLHELLAMAAAIAKEKKRRKVSK